MTEPDEVEMKEADESEEMTDSSSSDDDNEDAGMKEKSHTEEEQPRAFLPGSCRGHLYKIGCFLTRLNIFVVVEINFD
jgi:hypothetical protein